MDDVVAISEDNKAKPRPSEVVIGGSALSARNVADIPGQHGVAVCHARGMTEMSPLTLGSLKPECAVLTGEQRLDVQVKQGHAPLGVEMKIVDDEDKKPPRDGKTSDD
jgi:fatty-acyl-CoA synthase